MRTGLILVGLLHLSGGGLLPAQQRAAPFIRWEPATTSIAPTKSWRTPEGNASADGDHRYEGLAVGGLALGALGAWVGSQISAGCAIEPGGGCYTKSVRARAAYSAFWWA